jgi:hypothetical protein
LDFDDWKFVHNLMINKEHLTNVGRNQIILIQSNMNSNRKFKLNYLI